MGRISLPNIRNQPVAFEDCVSALFNAGGYHVERHIRHRDLEEVLELDTVATNYSTSPPTRVLVESKSGGWGYPDLFKALGWMKYLGFEQSVVTVANVPREKSIETINYRLNPHGLRVVYLNPDRDLVEQFVASGLSPRVDSISYQVWRYFYAQERALIKYVRARVKGEPGLLGAQELLRYYELVNDQIFFQADEYQRVRGLYEAFQSHPKLSLGIARELQGEPFDCNGTDYRNPMIRDAIYYGQHDLLQACFYVEHRARLAILKAAVDLVMSERRPKPALRSGNAVIFTELDFLPDTFRQGLDALREDKYAAFYPLFWQVFTWGFGGFMLENLGEQECEWLEEITGISRDDVVNALAAFDRFFPKTTSWFTTSYKSQCMVLQFVPMPIQGLGAFHRKLRYVIEDYSYLAKGDNTARDLRKWHNAGYQLLARRSDLNKS